VRPVGAWPDGHVIWSEDRVRGGPPYWEGQVPPERVSALLKQVERDGAFGDKRLTQPCFGPDSSFTKHTVQERWRPDQDGLVARDRWSSRPGRSPLLRLEVPVRRATPWGPAEWAGRVSV